MYFKRTSVTGAQNNNSPPLHIYFKPSVLMHFVCFSFHGGYEVFTILNYFGYEIIGNGIFSFDVMCFETFP